MVVLAYHALALLVGRHGEYPAHKKLSDKEDGGLVICLKRGANDLHVVQLMPLPPHHLLLH